MARFTVSAAWILACGAAHATQPVQWLESNTVSFAPAAERSMQATFARLSDDSALSFKWNAATAPSSIRASCRNSLRPVGTSTPRAEAIGALPMDDQLSFAGGVVERCGGNLAWSSGSGASFTGFVDRSRTRTLLTASDQVLNRRVTLVQPELLRQRVLNPASRNDLLDDVPIHVDGIIYRASGQLTRDLSETFAFNFRYTLADSRNDLALYRANQVPYVARQQASAGVSWLTDWGGRLRAAAVYRTERFADEANTVRIGPGWDAQVNWLTESDDKRWAVEIYGSSLFRSDVPNTYGVMASWRF